jgi:hypothetical protein
MDYINLIYYQDRMIQFKFSTTNDNSILFIHCGLCKFNSVYYQSKEKIKINLNNLVLSIFNEENNHLALERKPKILQCHKCKCEFSITSNIISVEKEAIKINQFVPNKELEKKIEEKQDRIILQEKIIESILPQELSKEEKEKAIDIEKQKQGEKENEKADNTKKEEHKKIAFTFVTGGRKKKL